MSSMFEMENKCLQEYVFENDCQGNEVLVQHLRRSPVRCSALPVSSAPWVSSSHRIGLCELHVLASIKKGLFPNTAAKML